MNGKLKKAGLCICCLCLLLGGLANATVGAEQTSILNRLQVVENPELGELIRIVVANTPEAKEAAEYLRRYTDSKYLELKQKADEAGTRAARAVTEAYAQIRLMDTQIKQIEAKIGASKAAIRAELILARAELEANRMTKLAELREIMNIVPKHAFGRQPVDELKNWLALDVIGDSVYVVKYLRPYHEWKRYPDATHVVGVMSQETVLESIRDLMKRPDELPLRVTIFRTESRIKVSEKLYEQVIEIIKKAKAQFKADVYLAEVRADLGTSEYLMSQNKIYDGEYNLRKGRPLDEQRFFENNIEWELTRPRRLPRKYSIEFDAESKDLAVRIVDAIKTKAKELGVERFVEIEQEETEFDIPDPAEGGQRGPRRGMRR